MDELKEKRERLQARASEITSQIEIEDAWLLDNPVGINSEMIADVESRLQQVESRILESRKLLTINEEREKANKLLEVRKQENEETLKDLFAKLQTAQLYEKDLELTKSVYEVLLPNYKNSKACDTLRKYMNTFLSSTKESFEVQLESTKKGVEFQYRPQPTDEFMNAKMASGFETAILTLAFKAAIASAYNSNLLVLDEPDKDADNDSSAAFFEALLSINGGFQQTILISHREEGVKLLKDNGAKIFKVLQGTFTSY
jgi:DNA repair exonuclease SbcCD ATPase subunit